MGYGLFALV